MKLECILVCLQLAAEAWMRSSSNQMLLINVKTASCCHLSLFALSPLVSSCALLFLFSLFLSSSSALLSQLPSHHFCPSCVISQPVFSCSFFHLLEMSNSSFLKVKKKRILSINLFIYRWNAIHSVLLNVVETISIAKIIYLDVAR